jgi:catechol 2,3-dioxygenase-like lactoylglutathione lyase family enzyme
LRPVLHLLLDHGQRVFQTGFDGVEKEITSREDPLGFGIGSIFVRDPDGNLIEFLQLGHGIFADRSGEDA